MSTAIQWTDETWARFIALIGVSDAQSCWEWSAGCFTSGYGQFRVGKRKVRAHRAYYERVVGPVPAGLILRHSCDNPKCCNPSHLTPGTHAENAADREKRGRGIHNGSSLPGELNPSAKLSAADARVIRQMCDEGYPIATVARLVGISVSQARNIAHRRSWRAA